MTGVICERGRTLRRQAPPRRHRPAADRRPGGSPDRSRARVALTLTTSTRSRCRTRAARSRAARMSGPTGRRRRRAPATARPGRRPGRSTDAARAVARRAAPVSFSASIGATRVARKAGAVPNSTAVATVTAAVNASTRQSSDRSRNDAVDGGRQLRHQHAAAPRREHQADHRADAGKDEAFNEQLPRQTPARRAERQPHAQFVAARGRPARAAGWRCWRTRSAGPARRSTRIVSSGRSYLLAQLRCADGRGHERERILQEFLSELRRTRLLPASSGRPRESAAARRAAWRSPRRATAGLQAQHDGQPRRSVGGRASVSLPRISGSAPSGTATSNVRPTSAPKNSGGVTPTIVNGTRSMTSGVPMTSAAPPKRRCHSP